MYHSYQYASQQTAASIDDIVDTAAEILAAFMQKYDDLLNWTETEKSLELDDLKIDLAARLEEQAQKIDCLDRR